MNGFLVSHSQGSHPQDMYSFGIVSVLNTVSPHRCTNNRLRTPLSPDRCLLSLSVINILIHQFITLSVWGGELLHLIPWSVEAFSKISSSVLADTLDLYSISRYFIDVVCPSVGSGMSCLQSSDTRIASSFVHENVKVPLSIDDRVERSLYTDVDDLPRGPRP